MQKNHTACKEKGHYEWEKEKDWRIKLSTSGIGIVSDILEEIKDGNQNMNKKQKALSKMNF